LDPDLRVKLESHLPPSLPVRSSTALFCFGHCFHRHRSVDDLELVVDGVRQRPTASRMPRRDLFEWLQRIGEDPEGRSYRSGFWATVPVRAPAAPGVVELQAAVGEQVIPLGQIEITAAPPAPPKHADATIAIVMPTFEPDLELFAIQIGSLRAQTDERWHCVISDDGSGGERYEAMRNVIGDDRRFTVIRAPDRLGPYRNFERALRQTGAQLLAPCDQDDRWYPDKLAMLRASLGNAQLVYSDQRLVAPDGRVLRQSLWEGRHRDSDNLASMLVANSVPGASMLFRREAAELALPFPDPPGDQYHDHWLALTALTSGEIAYVDRPLYDYVQHPAAVMAGAATPNARSRRGAYFGGYVGREVLAQTLRLRCNPTPSKRRALDWFIASQRSAAHFAWLTLRPLARRETLGGEFALAEGIAWRWLLPLATRRTHKPAYDASFPDPPRFEQPRLRRWRAGS
jgi:hypothetical protein